MNSTSRQQIIEAKSSNFNLNLKELVAYKDLFITLTWRDFRVRYAQTTIGFVWAFLQPLTTIAILHFVFGNLLSFNSSTPHLLFTVAGMCCWTYFSFVMTNAGSSIIANQDMVKKIYFPRLIIPLSKALVGLVDLGITLVILCVLFVYYGTPIHAQILLAPVFILMTMIVALSVGIWLSALTVKYRDFQQVVPFMVQLGLYITPVAYPGSFILKQLPDWMNVFYYLNPMAGIIEGFRWCLFDTGAFPNYAYISFLMVLLLFVSGIYYFQKTSDKMADYV